MSANFYQTMWGHIQEHFTLRCHCRERLEFEEFNSEGIKSEELHQKQIYENNV
jgi:hypothetical protein